ncbi:FAD-dependent oxidoreductase [Minwuia sp.]|uniref:FAD-dependent oxidoreductase n=1 Tax=Minwuia sp. TaxID=2493630 RepID=UPI003A918CF5
MSTDQRTSASRQAPRWLPPLFRKTRETSDFLSKTLWPMLDLFIRLWLGQTFLVAGIIKLGNWDSALFLATYEYPVSWLDPALAAALGAAIQVIGGLMIALGLGTRFAAVPMLILSLVIQFAYVEINVHLFWAILFGWYTVAGAGPVSLDRVLGRGFVRLPLPLVASFGRVSDFGRLWLSPFYLVFIRLWIAQIFFSAGLAKLTSFENTVLLFEYEYMVPLLPPDWAALLATFFELVCPVLLAVGLFTRLATLPLIAMTLVIQFTYLDHADHFYWILLLGMLALGGPGPISLDRLGVTMLRRAFPGELQPARWDDESLPHVVIVGAGFGGVAVAKGLRHPPCRVTLIDRRNYHLFQPLLYQVATAGLSPADIATPIRELFRTQQNVRTVMGRVTGIDTENSQVLIGADAIGYDHLVIATGARHAYFGKDAWEEHAPGLKKIPDATEIRGRILRAFEHAEAADDAAERQAWMTFVIVGGGPTGVETAGAIAELAHSGMEGEFRHADPTDARIILVQSGARLLPPFPEKLSESTKRSLERLGVEVRLGGRVTGIEATGVHIGDEFISARTAIWAAGVMASPASKWLQADHDRAGRVIVGGDLSVPGHPEIFVIGDTASSAGWDGEPVPGLAPAAKQGGEHVATVLHRRIVGRAAPAPFRYRHAGNLATIGRASAVADLGWITFSGAPAWWFWGVIHVMFLGSMRNRMSVAFEWMWAYLTFRRSTRLIAEKAE